MNIDQHIVPQPIPAALWNRTYRQLAAASGSAIDVTIALVRSDTAWTVFKTKILSLTPAHEESSTLRYLGRILKFIFCQRGGFELLISGYDSITVKLAEYYRWVYEDKSERQKYASII